MTSWRVTIITEHDRFPAPLLFRSFDVATRYIDQCARDLPDYADHLLEEIETEEAGPWS